MATSYRGRMATTIRSLGRFLAWALIVFVALLPVLGIIIGLLPLGHQHQTTYFADLETFFTFNGLWQSIYNSLVASLIAPLAGFYIAFSVYSQYRFRPAWISLEKRLAPLLSLPHLAVALGLVYLFSAGGVIDFGLQRKSLTTLIIAITIKEIPFFLFVISAIDKQLPVKNWLLQGRALGYSDVASWWLLVFPMVLKQSKLALIAAVAYTLSVIDVSLLVGPNVPQLFAVLAYQWQTGFNTLDLSFAFWSNLTLLVMLGFLVMCIYVHEYALLRLLKYQAVMANPLSILTKISKIALAWLPAFTLLSIAILLVFLLRSVEGVGISSADWSLFDPSRYSLSLWQDEWFFLKQPLINSLIIGFCATSIGLAFSLLALELQRQRGRYFADHLWLLAIILPQLSLVYGWQITHAWLDGSFSVFWVVLSHIPFVFAYCYLILKGPFQAIGEKYELIANSFGYSYWQAWWRIRFSLLRPTLLSAFAIGFSVSIAQYVPTLMIGAGRVPSITTEAVAIASGNDLNLTSVYILVQSSLPMIVFFIAILLASQLRGKANASD